MVVVLSLCALDALGAAKCGIARDRFARDGESGSRSGGILAASSVDGEREGGDRLMGVLSRRRQEWASPIVAQVKGSGLVIAWTGGMQAWRWLAGREH